MINKLLYWFVTVPARNLAIYSGAVVLLLVLGLFAMTRGASAAPLTPVATVTPATQAGAPTGTVVGAASPGFGGSLAVGNWTVTLQRMEPRPCVTLKTADGTTFVDNNADYPNFYYMFWVDATNNAADARTVRDSLSWAVRTENNRVYYYRDDQDPDLHTTGTWVSDAGRDSLSLQIAPAATAHPLLAFRTSNLKPLQLQVSDTSATPTTVTFDLSLGDNPTPTATPSACQ